MYLKRNETKPNQIYHSVTQSAGVVKYTGCFSAEGYDPTTTSVLVMTLKKSNGNAPEMPLGNAKYFLIAIATRFTVTWSFCT